MDNDDAVLANYTTKNAKVLVLASKKEEVKKEADEGKSRQPTKKKAKVTFEDVSNHLQLAREKYEALEAEVNQGLQEGVDKKELLETHQKAFLWFNSVIEVMTKIDTLKQVK